MKASVKIGNVNAEMPMALYNKRGKLIGWCADTPNAFACACQLRADVYKGIANYPYFGETARERDGEDNTNRMLWDNTTLSNSVKFN